MPALADENLSQESRRDLLKCYRRVCGWAHLNYGIPNAASLVAALPRRRSLPRVLSPGEIRSLLESCRSPRDELLVVLVLDTGLRLGEVATLKPRDIGEWWLSADGKSGQRQVPVSPEIRCRLEDMVTDGHIWRGQRGPCNGTA